MLSATESKDLGWYVADAGGFALYRFDQDTAKPPKSNCEAECASAWFPMPVSEVARADGRKQVTLAGRPLYRFPGDKTAGQTTGQCKGGTWWVVTPEGKKAQSDAAASPSGSGY
jgi:predicted lipoprotein with Yx(FWY)xxD motif